MNHRILMASAVALAATLVACGGGGGGTGNNFTPPSNPPTATPTPPTTTRQGTVVDDTSGAPLAGVKVQLDPWAAYPTPGPTPTPLLTTTTDANGHFVLSNVANGTYLLVIGPDAVYTAPPGFATPAPNATDTPIPGASNFQATVHDRIVLGGGGTAASPLPLVAPTMIPQPLYTPPPSETSGNYRLATISALTEAPCYLAYNGERIAHGQNPVVLDEWSTENSRAVAYVGTQGGGKVVTFLTTGNGLVGGGANCNGSMITGLWGSTSAKGPWVNSALNLWYGGYYTQFANQTQGAGAENFPNDPRVFVDPNNSIWP